MGHTAIDHISSVCHLPEKNNSSHISERQILFGGGAANIAAGIARLGEEVTLISCVGSDFSGSDYDLWMKRLGIRQQFSVVPDAKTPTAFMFTDTTGDQITFFEYGASEAFRSLEAPELPFVHLATGDAEFNARVSEKARSVSFDPGQDVFTYTKSQLEMILDNTMILFSNQHEMREICARLECSCKDLLERMEIAVITFGQWGSILSYQGDREKIPIVPVQVADPTGAGDAYRAGFLSSYMKGYPPLICSRIGTVTASFAVERIGCQTHLPDWETMEERYTRHFGILESGDK